MTPFQKFLLLEGSGGQQRLARKLRGSQRDAERSDGDARKLDHNRTLTRLSDREHDKRVQAAVRINRFAAEPKYAKYKYKLLKDKPTSKFCGRSRFAPEDEYGADVKTKRKIIDDNKTHHNRGSREFKKFDVEKPAPAQNKQNAPLRTPKHLGGGRYLMPVVPAVKKSPLERLKKLFSPRPR